MAGLQKAVHGGWCFRTTADEVARGERFGLGGGLGRGEAPWPWPPRGLGCGEGAGLTRGEACSTCPKEGEGSRPQLGTDTPLRVDDLGAQHVAQAARRAPLVRHHQTSGWRCRQTHHEWLPPWGRAPAMCCATCWRRSPRGVTPRRVPSAPWPCDCQTPAGRYPFSFRVGRA